MPVRPITDPPDEHREVIMQSSPADWEFFDIPETWVLTTNRDYSIAMLYPTEMENEKLDRSSWTSVFPDSTFSLNMIRVLYRGAPFTQVVVVQVDEYRTTIVVPNTDLSAAEDESSQVLTEFEMHLSDIMSGGGLHDYDLDIRIEGQPDREPHETPSVKSPPTRIPEPLRLRVEKGNPNDEGRPIARISPDVFDQLDAEPGDFVEITGADSVFARLYRSDRKHWNPETIHLNGTLREKAGVDVEDYIRIRHAGAREAQTITVSPSEETPVQFDADPQAVVKQQLRGRTLVEGFLLTISDKESRLSPRDKVFSIVETNPAGAVLVTPDTEFQIKSNDD
ncbi:hypothetical protein [Halomarina oriensis]|uniref:Uncharacterized protein n=1 Tax=Halomarina oriensis TaxID=671145 RepID=A0A6B0GSG8_9EURY|nr:hypothetical protein [Halomarina oriensis]MWG35045.1 hypothetical protein [Halomarina oriensis]